MKKKIYLMVISVITIACVTVGIMYHMLDFGRGSRWFRWLESSRGVISNTKSIEISDKNIELFADLSIATFNIRTGKRLEISYECSEKLVPEVNFEDGILTLTQANGNISILGKTKCEITLTVPDDVNISRMDLNIDLGDLIIRNINTDISNFTCGLGDIDIKNCQLGTANLACNMGDCDIENSSFQFLDVEMDMGDIEVKGGQRLDDYMIEASCGLGEIEINGRDYGTKFSQEGKEESYIKIKNGMGDIELEY